MQISPIGRRILTQAEILDRFNSQDPLDEARSKGTKVGLGEKRWWLPLGDPAENWFVRLDKPAGAIERAEEALTETTNELIGRLFQSEIFFPGGETPDENQLEIPEAFCYIHDDTNEVVFVTKLLNNFQDLGDNTGLMRNMTIPTRGKLMAYVRTAGLQQPGMDSFLGSLDTPHRFALIDLETSQFHLSPSKWIKPDPFKYVLLKGLIERVVDDELIPRLHSKELLHAEEKTLSESLLQRFEDENGFLLPFGEKIGHLISRGAAQQLVANAVLRGQEIAENIREAVQSYHSQLHP